MSDQEFGQTAVVTLFVNAFLEIARQMKALALEEAMKRTRGVL